jgi:hypothetical protein
MFLEDHIHATLILDLQQLQNVQSSQPFYQAGSDGNDLAFLLSYQKVTLMARFDLS